LQGNLEDACKLYKEALSIMNEMEAYAVARLQKLHCLLNLREVVSMNVQSSSSFLCSTKEICEVEEEYIAAKVGSV
jgi:hypothetical protein